MKKKFSFLISLIGVSFNIYAIQNIEIIGGNNAGNPKIAVVNFTGDNPGESSVADIITNDLNVTGEFAVKEYPSLDAVDKGTQYVITGSMQSAANGTVKLAYKIANNNESAASLLNQNLSYSSSDTRNAAHMSSNTIYKKLTNTPGIFTSKIAYILQKGSQYSIIISDYDGYNQKTMVSTKAPLTSLAWNTTGTQIAYVSFESGKPVVYVQEVYKANRYPIANFTGSNSSPAFNPSGFEVAVTLTKDDGSHVYLVNNRPFNAKSTATNLINFGTIDTEASFDSKENIVFTSNHDGGPQIFMTNMQGATPIRLTMNLGKYNTTARFSHDSSKITFINRNSGTLRTYVLDLATRSAYPVSPNTSLDISPSFAPNDKLILLSSDNQMYIANTTGTTETRLNQINSGAIIDQRWANNFDTKN